MSAPDNPFDGTLPRVTKEEQYPDWNEEKHMNAINPSPRYAKTVDLVFFGQILRSQPIYSRQRLKKIQQLVEQAKSDQTRTIKAVDMKGRKRIVWAGKHVHDEDNSPIPEYLTYVELAPTYKVKKYSDNVRLLHRYNKHEGTPIPMPGVIRSWFDMSLPTPPTPDYWDQEVQRARLLWNFSLSKLLLQKKFRKDAKAMVQVKKIVCFGNGTLCVHNCNENGEEDGIARPDDSLLQHLAAFTIAETINEKYNAGFHTEPIQVIFQDPQYQDVDRRIWPHHYNHDVKFVEDPQEFL